ncbi:MAG TPA: hypothetical protein VMT38_06220 [Terracidiphilus sp.]|nr:hypothetical protein [Terracidiphilus sp.]
MKIWNLSSFEEVVPNVLSSVDKDSSAEVHTSQKRPLNTTKRFSMGLVGTVILVASISVASVQMRVSGNDSKLRISTIPSITNVQNDRPPLALLFDARHDLKWDATKEQEMLERAAAAVAITDRSQNAANVIHSALREGLPRDRKDADDLAKLGIKLG